MKSTSTIHKFGNKIFDESEIKYSYLGFLQTKKIIFNYKPSVTKIIDRLEDETTLELWLETYKHLYKPFLKTSKTI